MATKDTGGQQRSTKRSDEMEEAPAGVESAEASERKEQLDEDIDAILDEIDEALETNSEEFVRSFVQKGGQ